jgi:hypothetical protein
MRALREYQPIEELSSHWLRHKIGSFDADARPLTEEAMLPRIEPAATQTE